MAFQTKTVHKKMLDLTNDGSIEMYHRWDVQDSLEDIGFDEWKPRGSGALKIKIIEDATTQYLQQEDTRCILQDCALRLVATRRARAQTPNWEGFTFGIRYQCPFEDCIKAETLYRTREDMLDHLQRVHLLPPPDPIHHKEVQDVLDAARIVLAKDSHAAVFPTSPPFANVTSRLSDSITGGIR